MTTIRKEAGSGSVVRQVLTQQGLSDDPVCPQSGMPASQVMDLVANSKDFAQFQSMFQAEAEIRNAPGKCDGACFQLLFWLKSGLAGGEAVLQ